jgi:hypothetical protein
MPVIGSGWLTFDSFRRLVDDNPWVEEIELSNYGEIFLNPQLSQIMEYSHQRGHVLTCDNGTNFKLLLPLLRSAPLGSQVVCPR